MDTKELQDWWRYEASPERLKEIRKALGMSQGTMGKVMGTTASTISRWENEHTMPGSKFLEFYMLFDKFTKKHKFMKGDVKRMMAKDGYPFALYTVLKVIFEQTEGDDVL